MGHELNDADELILDHLLEGRHDDQPWGRNSPQNIAADLDYSRQYIQNRLKMLQAADYVENLGGGVYEFRKDPREADATE
ncbi:MarR family transcriptional regulator (plasmid) [Natrinema thermotolerans]|nr:MarR family transcriptional regulator [Natrinema thermotolerans]